MAQPSQRHVKKDVALLARRQEIYERARAQHPHRWSGPTRNWEPVGEVWLNPDQEATPLEAPHCQAYTNRCRGRLTLQCVLN